MGNFFALALGFACVAVATGGDVALLWSQAPLSAAPWTARSGHTAAIFADGTVLSLGGNAGGSLLCPCLPPNSSNLTTKRLSAAL